MTTQTCIAGKEGGMNPGFDATLHAVHRDSALRRLRELLAELTLAVNWCDITLDQLPAHQHARSQKDNEEAKRILRAIHALTASADRENNEPLIQATAPPLSLKLNS